MSIFVQSVRGKKPRQEFIYPNVASITSQFHNFIFSILVHMDVVLRQFMLLVMSFNINFVYLILALYLDKCITSFF